MLGTARIVRNALLRPARIIPSVEVTVVGSRDGARGSEFARRNGIGRSVVSYRAVVDDPTVDAIYIPLPNSQHAEWTIRAIRAGKHVLCEKPSAMTAVESRRVAETAHGSPVAVVQAFHYRYHPFFERQRQHLANGELGQVRSIRVSLCVPLPPGPDIRWDYELGGGAMMDLGCYAVHMLRSLTGEEPSVQSAAALTVRDHRVDRAMKADLRFPSGIAGRLTVSLRSARILTLSIRVVGDAGTLHILNPLMPHLFGRSRLRNGAGVRIDHAERRPSYSYQLEAFRDAALSGAPVRTGMDDALATMRVIDEVYATAGITPRTSMAEF
ncbi:Gfo/Idh/MocA family protein [Leifsonia shinshuensis]|uniref:Gfo/Idh/MocA family protein n=1 Tax=Leifsonia shinshuensis TaxID=150026 RepID=UPI0036D41730